MPCTSAMCHNSIQYTWWLTTLFNVQVHWTLSSQDPPGTTMLVEQKQGFGTAKHLQNQYVLIHHFGPNMIPLCRPSPPLKWLVFDGFCCCDCFHESWFGWDGEKIQKDVEAFYDFHGFFCHQRQNWHPIKTQPNIIKVLHCTQLSSGQNMASKKLSIRTATPPIPP